MPPKAVFAKKTGFTLMEILVSSLILAMIAYGLMNVFLATKGRSMRSRSVITAAELERHFLGELPMQVRQDWWENPGTLGPHNFLTTTGNYRAQNLPAVFSNYQGPEYLLIAFEEPEYAGRVYYPVYEIQDVGGVRRVRLILCWQEPDS